MICDFLILTFCESFKTLLVWGNGLLKFIQSNSGSFISAVSALIGVWLMLRYYKGKEERERRSLLKAAYNALKSEIEINKKNLETGIGKTLDETKGPLLARGAFDWEHDIMYKANARIICYIPDIELIKEIVRLYGLLGALKDASRKHNAEVERRNDIAMATEKTGVKNYQLKQIDKSIDILTRMMQSCYKETERQTELALQKLETQI